MEKRKIIKFGKSSYVITIPNEWIKKNNLLKGDALNSIESSNSITYSIPKNQEEKEIDLDLDKYHLKIFNKILISYYLKNYKYIKIHGKKISEKFDDIKIFIEKLPSIEIYEITENYILLKDISDIENMDISVLIDKMIGISKILFEKVKLKENHNFVMQLDSNINKLSFIGYKIINYNLNKNDRVNLNKNSIYYWRMIFTIENIGDILKRINRYIKFNSNNKNISKIHLMIDSVNFYFNFISKFCEKNLNIENNLDIYLDKKQSLLKELNEYKEDLEKENLNIYLVIHQLLKDIIGQIDVLTLSIIDIYNNN